MNHFRPRPLKVGTALSIITDAQLIEEIEADFSPKKQKIKVEGTRKRKERELKCVNGLIMPVGLSPARRMVPIPLFREIKEDRASKKQRPFELPPKYITYDEPTPDEEEHIIEYDMDSDDENFLSTLNKQSSVSKAKHLACLKHEEFETLFDLFEKTHQKIKEGNSQSFPDVIAHLFRVIRYDDMEDIPCAVCNDGEFTDDNMIIFCDGCDIGVHQHCYGLNSVPPDDFYCDRCKYLQEWDKAQLLKGKHSRIPEKCEFCTVSRGAFKPLMYLNNNGKHQPRWAHITCAMWIPECSFANTETLDPIFSLPVSARNKHKCCVCNQRSGVCVKCSEKDCHKYFHVMCGRSRDFSIYARPAHIKEEKKNNMKSKKRLNPKHSNRDYNDNLVDGENVEFVQYCATHSLKSEIQRTDSHFGFSVLTNEELGELDAFVTSSRGLGLPAYSTELVYWYWRWRKKNHKGSFLRKFQALSPLAAFLAKHETTPSECMEKMRVMRQQMETLRIILDLVKKREHLKQELAETSVSQVEMQIKRVQEYVDWWKKPRRSPRKNGQPYYEEDEQLEDYEQVIEREEIYKLVEEDPEAMKGPPQLLDEDEHQAAREKQGKYVQLELADIPDNLMAELQQEEREDDTEIDVNDREEVDSNVSSGGEHGEPPPTGSLPGTPNRNTLDSDNDVSGAEESFDSLDLEVRFSRFNARKEAKEGRAKMDSIKNGFMRGGTVDEPIVIDDVIEEIPKKQKIKEDYKKKKQGVDGKQEITPNWILNSKKRKRRKRLTMPYSWNK